MLPDGEQSQRVVLSFDLHIDNKEATAKNPLLFRVPRVVHALRQQGEVTVMTTGDYRLRWQTSRWVRGFFGRSDDSTINRVYQFRFYRGEFELPIWLAADERRVTVASNSRVKVSESVANMQMDIQLDGQVTDNRSIQLIPSGWRILSVVDPENGETLPKVTDQAFSIELNSGGREQSQIQVLAQHAIVDPSEIQFDLPRIQILTQDVSVGTSYITFEGSARNVMVLNLSKCNGLERSPLTDESSASFASSRFRISATDSGSQVFGSLAEQPQQITLAAKAEIRLSGEFLTSKAEWIVNPQSDLGGSLPVRFPGFKKDSSDTVVGNDDVLQRGDTSEVLNVDLVPPLVADDKAIESDGEDTSGWVATVNGAIARLVQLDEEIFELQSDILADQEVVVRWTKQEELAPTNSSNQVLSVGLPLPAIADVTVQGDIAVSVQGDSQSDLSHAESSAGNERFYSQLPDKIRVRWTKRTRRESDLSIRKALLRSAVGSRTRYEQLIAQVQGGDTMKLGLPNHEGQIDVVAFVNGARAEVIRNDSTLQIPLVDNQNTHVVDVRLWADEVSVGILGRVRPMLQMPLRAGRVFWEVRTPSDGHVVWASPSAGRAMNWQFDRWRLVRKPIRSDTWLAEWVGATDADNMPPGNRYLYIGSDIRSFQVRTMTLPWLWFLVGGFVLGLASLLCYIPATRNPLTVVAIAVLFAGVLCISPDAAIMVGQLAMMGLILVVIMFLVRSLVSAPRHSQTPLSTRIEMKPTPPSTRTLVKNRGSSNNLTQELAQPARKASP